MSLFPTKLENGLEQDHLVKNFLDYADSIYVSIKANKTALVGDLGTIATATMDAVSAKRDEVVKELNSLNLGQKDMITRHSDIELATTVGKAKIKQIVNKEPLIANVVAKYTASVLKPIKSSSFKTSSGRKHRRSKRSKRRYHRRR